MRMRELMSRGVECIAPEATLQQAARRMRELDVGVLPICTAGLAALNLRLKSTRRTMP